MVYFASAVIFFMMFKLLLNIWGGGGFGFCAGIAMRLD
jgi:hypothetical protein